MKKTLHYFILSMLFISCKNPPKNGDNTATNITADTVKPAEIRGQKIILDSIFTVSGKPYQVNGIPCRWEYNVKRSGTNEYNIVIMHQKLLSLKGNKVLFENDNEADGQYNSDMMYKKLEHIQTNGEYNIECKDVNDDGYCDIRIVTERAAAGANTTYDAFLFNPKTNKFEHSALFSGTNIEYDEKKNRLSTMWKMSVNDYTYTYIYLTNNKRDVAYMEEFVITKDSISYKKVIGKKIVKQKSMSINTDETEDNTKFIKQVLKSSH